MYYMSYGVCVEIPVQNILPRAFQRILRVKSHHENGHVLKTEQPNWGMDLLRSTGKRVSHKVKVSTDRE